ncbi:MAG: carotenoid biosynthesis protein [Candidatus Alcyoniella australis]|nr:carotenoid biosynthesis protein [Candidatus Alcyoniella australis]
MSTNAEQPKSIAVNDGGLFPYSRGEMLRETLRSLPIWFFYLETLGVMSFMTKNVPRERFLSTGHTVWEFAATAVFPLSIVLAYFHARIMADPRITLKDKALRVIYAALIGPLVLWLLIIPYHPLEDAAVKSLFEYMQLFWIAVFMVHALVTRGTASFVTFYVVGFSYGLLLENTDILLGFFDEPMYNFYLGFKHTPYHFPAPFCTMMGWCLVFYCCTWAAEKLREHWTWFARTPLRSAFLTTFIALLLDSQLDPLASLSGIFWAWHPSLGSLPKFVGVPIVNYVAWFSAFLPFSYAYFLMTDRRQQMSWAKRNWLLFLAVPFISVVAGTLNITIMALIHLLWDPSWSSFKLLENFLIKIHPYAGRHF